MKELRAKLHILMENNCIELRPYYTEQHLLVKDKRDVENDFYSLTFCEIEYLINRETVQALNLIFNFFVSWQIFLEHKKFIGELNEKYKYLPAKKDIQIEFYKNEWEKQFNKFSQLNKSVTKSKWLSYLLENGVALIYDFEFAFLNLHNLKGFIQTFKKVKPTFDINNSYEVIEKEIDLFYDNFEAFYLIEKYFKSEKLQLIYEAEIIEKNMNYLSDMISNFDNLVVKDGLNSSQELEKNAIAMLIYYRGINRALEDDYVGNILKELNIDRNDNYKKKIKNFCSDFYDDGKGSSILKTDDNTTIINTRIKQITSILVALKNYPECEAKALGHLALLSDQLSKKRGK